MGARFDVHARHRRFLSLDRSTGAQSPRDVMSGRTQRESRWALIEHETEAAAADFDAPRPARVIDPPWTVVDVLGAVAVVALLGGLLLWAVMVGTGEIGSMLRGLL